MRNRSCRLLPLLGAAVFVGFYIVNDLVRSAVATSPLPLPNAPDDDIYRYVTGEPLAVGLPAAAHLLSSVGLLIFVLASRQVEPRRAGDLADRWSRLVGLVAVATLTTSAALSTTPAVAASSGSTAQRSSCSAGSCQWRGWSWQALHSPVSDGLRRCRTSRRRRVALDRQAAA